MKEREKSFSFQLRIFGEDTSAPAKAAVSCLVGRYVDLKYLTPGKTSIQQKSNTCEFRDCTEIMLILG